MGIEIGIGLLKDIFVNTSFAGSYWIWQLVFLFGSMAIISRQVGDWKTLALPVISGWHLIGFEFSWIFFGVSGLLFVMDNLSTKMMEGAIGGVTNVWKKNIFREAGRERIRLEKRKKLGERVA